MYKFKLEGSDSIPNYTPTPPKQLQNLNSSNYYNTQLEQVRKEIEKESSKSNRSGFMLRQTARNFLYDTEKLVNRTNDRASGYNAIRQFGAALGDELKDVDTYAVGALELANNLTLANIVKKLEQNGNQTEQLSRSEQLVLQAAALRAAAEDNLSGNQSIAQRVASGIGQSIPFMGQYALTGGIGSTAAAITKKAATNELANMAIKGGLNRALSQMTGTAAKVTTMTALQPSTYADIEDRKLGRIAYTPDQSDNIQYSGRYNQLERKEANTKGFTASAINNLSEGMGKGIAAVGKSLNSRVIGKIAPTLAETIENVSQPKLVTWAESAAKKSGFNGMASEFLEEQPATALNALLVGDNEVSDLLDPEQQAVTALSSIAFGSVFQGMNHLNQKDVIRRQRNEWKNAENYLKEDFGEENAKLANEICLGISLSNTIEELATTLNHYWENVGDELTKLERRTVNRCAAERAKYLAIYQKGALIEAENRRTSGETPTNPLTQWSTMPLSVTQEVGEGLSREPINMDERADFARNLASQLRIPKLTLYETQNEAVEREEGLRVDGTTILNGFYRPKEDNIALVLENIPSKRSIAKTLLHESIGHRGVIGSFDDQGAEFYNNVYNRMSKVDKTLYGTKYPDPNEMVQEYVADIAGKLINRPTIWQQICWDFRQYLHQKLGVELPLTNNDIRFILNEIRTTSVSEGIEPPNTETMETIE